MSVRGDAGGGEYRRHPTACLIPVGGSKRLREETFMTPIPAAFYVRVSRKRQAPGHTIESQTSVLNKRRKRWYTGAAGETVC